jgi:rRNA-processing protein FCF1
MNPPPRANDQNAVVIDTNFVGRGKFSLDVIAKFAKRLLDHRLQLIIPEFVIWEWAEHAHSDIEVLAAAVKTAGSKIDRSLFQLGECPGVPDIEVLIGEIETLLSEIENVQIEASEPQEALGALRQQVLQIGAGSKKEGVKTGAADALLVQLAERLLDTFDRLAVATSDKLLAATAQDIAGPVTVVQTQKDLWDWDGLHPTSAEIARKVEVFVRQRLMEFDYGTPYTLLQSGYVLDRSVFQHLDVTPDCISGDVSISVSTVDEIEITSDQQSSDTLAILEVAVNASCLIVYSWKKQLEDELSHDSGVFPLRIRSAVTVDLDDSGQPIELSTDDRADITFNHDT